MAQKQMSNVLYFVPEDGETEKQMNIFLIQKAPEQVTLADIRSEFPMPGEYHFRFQYAFKQSDCKIWMDLCSEDQHVPQYDGDIKVKATRKSWHTGMSKHHRVQVPQQQVKFQEMVLASYDAAKLDQGKGSLSNAAYSLFNRAKGVLGGVASSVQKEVN